MITEVDEWWASLPIKSRLNIGAMLAGGPVVYPVCNQLWHRLPEERKERIRKTMLYNIK